MSSGELGRKLSGPINKAAVLYVNMEQMKGKEICQPTNHQAKLWNQQTPLNNNNVNSLKSQIIRHILDN